ncbi:hypothetical protein [Diplocloster agilis]|uniref:Uncharacterized protein n=1 Tax=Diplocloster agilis TaxID=2850323 RepID=A0A949K597_9FIRM|nr:hypothetical protein [Diplocloster agilis]MBU9739315.1 hypothetical protein [Diplocloster agilis]MBU9746597.1 hypothetical protein [Diplocloster agilis]
MATSTFRKQFAVRPDRANEFVAEMTKTVTPTLKSGFRSNLKHEKDLRESLLKALR